MRISRMYPFYLGISLILYLLAAMPVKAHEVAGVTFDKKITSGEQSLEIRGIGVLRYMHFIKVYAGALYTLPGINPEAVLSDTPKRIEVEYFQGLKAEDFGPATYAGLKRNLKTEEIERLRERIDYHNSLYQDVQPGDRYALTYIPGKGTELALNGQPVGIVKGADFAAAMFSLWLGDKPYDNEFKKALLGLTG